MKRLKYSILPAAAIIVLVAAALIATPWLVEQVSYAAETGQSRSAKEQLEHARDLSEAFKQVAKVVRPSVVNITSVKSIEPIGHPEPFRSPWFDKRPFGDFFGEDFFDRFFRFQVPKHGFERRGLGTGVIVRKDGYILTNNHVVRDADEVTVKLSNGKTHKAKVVGTDPKTDLAVVMIDAKGLTAATLGNSTELDVGEWVLAVGNPFGLEQTVTAGIVSATARANVGIAEYEDFIQTDAAINPGNSGGPLLNLKGEVIGINTAIVTRTGGYQGIGFAVPINMAKSIMGSLIQTGRVDRGWLGVLIQDLDEDMAKSFKWRGADGVLIGDVTKNSPAEKAGLRSGDIILEYDGEAVEDVNQLRNLVAATAPGKEVALRVHRDGKKETIKVKVGQLETAQGTAEEKTGSTELGLSVQTLSAELAQKMGIEEAKGVVVTGVEPNSPAARVGIRPNDVVLSVNGAEVADTAAFTAALAKCDLASGLRMRIKTGGLTRFVFIKAK